ncbi:quinol dehydrogenase ferredoxin subunit NapH [Campylobacter pinnipediorum]|uniref:quinol dehydrogenase ferredoxin subunit NapH n=1 Tax=Campylobacter pinnipediorum TaxID=1965231 RepID=UPI00084DBF1F|nr:quinol dehydrogenase ferredoxin subunit NapH [Campylobacter pinnipediorum]OPA76541.1 quinol dehydrogenase ferredoxin subunit NapH [Campylobacter pinnipediorum subsp. pinnipediorum]
MKVLFFRRFIQISLLVLFISSNYYGLSLLKGDFSSSLILNTIPLSDPFAVLQLSLAGFSVGLSAILGAFIVFIFYALIAPRAFCSWVCPVNLFVDIAFKLRQKLGFEKEKKLLNLSKKTRYFMLLFALILSFVLSFAAFESVSYIGLLARAIIFLNSSVFGIILCIIVFEMFIMQRGICSHLCPLGAFYAIISRFSFIRVAHELDHCTKCNKCKIVCPEVQVLDMIGKRSDFVKNTECISCGRCIDVCNDNALKFSIRNLRRKNEN